MVSIGLYIHIPFCLRKCFYCDFYSIPIGRVKEDILAIEDEGAKLIDRYIKALCREIEECRAILKEADFSVDSIYIGGGTPSLVDNDEIGRILNACKAVFKVAENAEVTIEANPGTVSNDSLKYYLKLGINRLSLGCQSFVDEELKRIGRVHKVLDIYKGFELAKEIGFKNINIDLIFGIPGQSVESFKSSLYQAISLKPEHISLYNLTIEENTHFQHLLKTGELELPDEDKQIRMYEYGIKCLRENQFEHYEISNFALRDKRCRHNENYWKGGEYLSFGAGAHSFLKLQIADCRLQIADSDKQAISNERRGESLTRPIPYFEAGKRWWNLKDVDKYCEAVEKRKSPIEGEEILEESKILSEAIMLGLRMIEGIDTKDFLNRYGVSIEERYEKEIGDLKKESLLELKDGRLKLTHKGILFSNEVFLRFMP